MLDLISIGDATLDTFVKINDASVMCTLEKEMCMLCLNYADKIPIARLDQKVAGNALNNAVGSARLGLKVALYTVLGNDDTAKRIMTRLEKEKISKKYVVVQKNSASNYSVVLNYKGERTLLVYHHPRKYDLPDIDKPRWIYYTSVCARGVGMLNRQLVAHVKHRHNFLAFNPGTYQIKQGLRALNHLFKVTDILFVNKEEAQSIVGNHPTMKKLMHGLKEHVPGRIVITDGSHGS